MESVNVHEAKTQFSKLMERAHAGEEIIVAKAGEPYARLVPLEKTKRRPPGGVTIIEDSGVFEPLPEDELLLWEGEGG
ncbi:type II toxin-antitoxin system Phd/YefM family antitoxin [Sediminivirga luteola]|nr:type II toxin-antitoxin system prevent-host-death family antitoxin [Sediminivirga luteola]